MYRPARLSARIIFAVATTTLLCVTALVTALLIQHHHAVHTQTDALLIRLAEAEAVDSTIDHDRPHLHASSITAPALGAGVTEKYAAVINQRCEVVVATANVHATRVSSALCPTSFDAGEHWTRFSDELADEPLRVGGVVARSGEERLSFIVGIAHREVDAATWRTTFISIPIALLASLLIIASAAAATRLILKDVHELSATCEGIQLQGLDDSLDAALERLEPRAGSPHEVQQLSRTLAEALRTVRRSLGERQRFIAEAAHELRTPLTSLRGELELALRRERNAAAYQEALRAALHDTRALQRMAEHLLETARWEDHKVELEALGADEVRALAESTLLDLGLDLRLSGFEAVTGTTLADRTLLSRILFNLAQNALTHGDAQSATLALRERAGEMELTFRDEGKGLRLDADRLFLPFERSEQSSGFGLGLYLSKELARAMRGDLRVAESEASGVTFILTLPRAKPQRA